MKYIKSFLIIGALAVVIAFQNCQKNTFISSSATDQFGSATNQSTLSALKNIRYFRGGFFAQLGQPNWSHDITITFESHSADFPISGAHPDPLCFRAGNLPLSDANSLLTQISSLQLATSDGPIMADGGIETVEINFIDGKKYKYHLLNGEVPSGEKYALNPDDLSIHFKKIADSLAVGCK